MSENRCVCCGEIIPEGRQVCTPCMMGVSPILSRDDTAFLEGKKAGRKEALEEALEKFDEYGSVWIQYTVGRETREQFAHKIVNSAKECIVDTLKGMLNDIQTTDT